jgi:hypothetical protein
MFDYDSVIVFILRICIFFLVLFSYPVVNYVARGIFLKAVAPGKKISYPVELAMNFIMAIIPLSFALFYPNVGSILAYVGGVSGFTIIYCFGTFCHLKLLFLKAFWPELAKTTETNRLDSNRLGDDLWYALHKILISRATKSDKIKKEKKDYSEEEKKKHRRAVWKFYIHLVLHVAMICMGLVTMITQFIPKSN